MDAQITRAQGHRYDHDPLHHSAGIEGDQEDHHGKKSILKKVKAKAKKVKDTIASKAHAGHGHGHDYEHEPNQDEEDDDEYDEDDDELVQDPEVDGAPTVNMGPDVNSARARASPTPTLGENVCPGTFQTKVTDADPSVPAPSMYDSVAPWDSSLDHDAKTGQFKGTLGEKLRHTDVPDKFGGETDVLKQRPEDPSPIFPHAIKMSDRVTVTANEPASPKRHGAGHDENLGFFKSPLDDEQPRDDVSLNTPKRRHEDVSPAKASDFGATGDHHTGVSPADAGVTPILHSFDKMAIYDEPEQHKKESLKTGSHHQFSPSESFGSAADLDHPQDMNVDQPNTQQVGYTGKVSSVASAIADKAIAAKNAVASKVGYAGNQDNTSSQYDVNRDANVSGLEPQRPQGAYTEKLSSATTALADKAASAKNVVASKLGYGGTDNAPIQVSNMNENVHLGGSEANVSGLEPPKPQGTYTEKLSSATAAIADKAASAKNVVASKLGYGGTDNSAAAQGSEINKEGDNATEQSAGGVTGYGRQIATTVTGKLAPVYGTVAGAGSAVLSKLPGTGKGTQQKTGEDEGIGATHERTTDDMGMGSVDKGVGMKGYIAEKLKPSDEDKALSEMISDALHKRGNTVEVKRNMGEGAQGNKRVHDAVKDALHKRAGDENMDREKMNVPMGKVTESEEVASRLGSSEEERTGKVYPGTGNESPTTGVVDKVKGAFTNWFGKGGEMNPSMAFNDQNTQSQGSTGEEQNASVDGERRLQAN